MSVQGRTQNFRVEKQRIDGKARLVSAELGQDALGTSLVQEPVVADSNSGEFPIERGVPVLHFSCCTKRLIGLP